MKPVPSASRRVTSNPFRLATPAWRKGPWSGVNGMAERTSRRAAVTVRRERRPFVLALFLGVLTAPAVAADMASLGIERHWTSNALDSERAVPGWYSQLRGTLAREWGDPGAGVRLQSELLVRQFDTVAFEDDRTIAMGVEAFGNPVPGVELRGTLSYRAGSEGDDLQIGPLTIGTRTLKQVVGFGLQAGFALGDAVSLILEATDNFEKSGRTHFFENVAPPARLESDRNRMRLTARLTRTDGPLAMGASTSLLVLTAEQLGFPPVALSLMEYSLRAEAAYTASDGASLGIAAGGQWLRGQDDIFRQWRPTFQAALSRPLPSGFDLRATCVGRYESEDSDDPLASWLQRLEVEVGRKISEDLAVGVGIFGQIKRNLLLENHERSRGLYLEITRRMDINTALALRMDYAQTIKTVIDARKRKLDLFIGVTARL